MYLRLGEQDRAIAVLQKAIKLSPNAFEPRFLLGSAYNRLNRFQDAVNELERAVHLGGDESEVFYHLARAYGGLGREDARRTALARFAELSKQAKEDAQAKRNASRLVAQAKSFVDSGDLNGALARVEEARELRPSDDTILFRLASLNFDLRRYTLAREYAQEAISLAPSEWLYHFLLGLAESREGHWRQARSSLEIAVKLNPCAADAHNALGEASLREGDVERAIASFEKASQLDPHQEAYRLNLEAVRKAAGARR